MPKGGSTKNGPEIATRNQLEDALWDETREAMKASIGRPSRYHKEYCAKLVEYFMRERPYRTVQTMFGPKEIPTDLPTLAGFAMEIGVHRDTLHEWANATDKSGKLKHPEFSDAIKKAKTVQEMIWATNSLRKLYDKTFAIFFGKNNLDYRDKYEVEETRTAGYEDLEDVPKAKSAAEARRLAGTP